MKAAIINFSHSDGMNEKLVVTGNFTQNVLEDVLLHNYKTIFYNSTGAFLDGNKLMVIYDDKIVEFNVSVETVDCISVSDDSSQFGTWL